MKFADSKTSGEEFREYVTQIQDILGDGKMFPEYSKDRKLGEVHGELYIRFPKEVTRQVINPEREAELWLALAKGIGISDPGEWETETGRRAWEKRNGSQGSKSLKSAQKARGYFTRIKNRDIGSIENALGDLVACDRKLGRLCIKTMLHLANKDDVVIRGRVSGKKLTRGMPEAEI